jgi:hypothetical protein
MPGASPPLVITPILLFFPSSGAGTVGAIVMCVVGSFKVVRVVSEHDQARSEE